MLKQHNSATLVITVKTRFISILKILQCILTGSTGVQLRYCLHSILNVIGNSPQFIETRPKACSIFLVRKGLSINQVLYNATHDLLIDLVSKVSGYQVTSETRNDLTTGINRLKPTIGTNKFV